MRSVRAVPCTSVVDPAQKPALPQGVVENTVKSALWTGRKLRGIQRFWILPRWGAAVLRPYGDEFDFEIPFILMPGVFLPPISGAAPRARCRHYFTAHPLQIHAHWLLVAQF